MDRWKVTRVYQMSLYLCIQQTIISMFYQVAKDKLDLLTQQRNIDLIHSWG